MKKLIQKLLLFKTNQVNYQLTFWKVISYTKTQNSNKKESNFLDSKLQIVITLVEGLKKYPFDK